MLTLIKIGSGAVRLYEATDGRGIKGTIDRTILPLGVTNTGNPQNVTDLLQAASETDDFEFEEVGLDVTVDPESPTTCVQQVNQAASASG